MSVEQSPARRVVKVSKLMIAEAKLRIALDRRLGRKTPLIVFKIAEAKPAHRQAS